MKKTLLAAALSLIALPSFADTTINGKLSTLGLGLEAAFPIAQAWDARLGFNTYSYNFNKASASGPAITNYSGSLNLQSFEALADWHPWEGSFRVSGGLVYNNNKFTMTALPGSGSTFNVGGAAVPLGAGQYVTATVDFNKVAPYLGVGWGRTPKNTGLSFTSDLGVVFQGTPRGAVSTNLPGATAADVANANASLNNALNSFNVYPVLSVGVGYTW